MYRPALDIVRHIAELSILWWNQMSVSFHTEFNVYVYENVYLYKWTIILTIRKILFRYVSSRIVPDQPCKHNNNSRQRKAKPKLNSTEWWFQCAFKYIKYTKYIVHFPVLGKYVLQRIVLNITIPKLPTYGYWNCSKYAILVIVLHPIAGTSHPIWWKESTLRCCCSYPQWQHADPLVTGTMLDRNGASRTAAGVQRRRRRRWRGARRPSARLGVIRIFVLVVVAAARRALGVVDLMAAMVSMRRRRRIVPRLDVGGSVHLEHEVGAGGDDSCQREHGAPLVDGRLRLGEQTKTLFTGKCDINYWKYMMIFDCFE